MEALGRLQVDLDFGVTHGQDAPSLEPEEANLLRVVSAARVS
jgi:hypothetical protein